MSHFSRHSVVLFVAALAVAVSSCTPEQWVIQHAAKGHYSQGYKYVGVDVERSSVRIRGWSHDSAAIAVHILADTRAGYSFGVDSVDDTLLLLGKYAGDAHRPGHRPEAILDVPENADIFIAAGGSIHVDGTSGPLRLEGTDTIMISSNPRGAVTARSSNGMVTIELPRGIDADLDLESGPGGTVRLDSENFRGTRQNGLARGVLGKGGIKISLKGARGVEVQFH